MQALYKQKEALTDSGPLFFPCKLSALFFVYEEGNATTLGFCMTEMRT